MQHLMPSIGTATLAYKIDAAQYQGPSQEQQTDGEKSAGARSILRNGKRTRPLHSVATSTSSPFMPNGSDLKSTQKCYNSMP